jgi:hypothetical protein
MCIPECVLVDLCAAQGMARDTGRSWWYRIDVDPATMATHLEGTPTT